MSEVAGFDLDRDTARAWSRFQARLADRIVEMTDEDVLVVDVEVAEDDVDGAAPYVQFAVFGEGTRLRGEVSSNGYLAARYALDDNQADRLVALGWSKPTVLPEDPEGEGSSNFFVDLPAREADRLAVMAVKALREVFAIAHPVFLVAPDLVEDADVSALPQSFAETADEPLATMPECDEQLRDLVDAALRPLFGQPPEKDEDGDIPVPWGSSLVYVRVEQDVPIIQLYSVVVDGVTDTRRAAFEVNVLNRDVRFLKFVLVEDRVIAQIHMPAWPFVPEHLRTMLTGMSRQIDELDEDLVARVGGRQAIEPSDEPADGSTVPQPATSEIASETALTTLLQLEASGPVDPRLAAGVCGFDQALIVRLLHETEGQEIAWRRSRDQALRDGDTDRATACVRELVAWKRTTSLLRRSLRVVVDRSLGREASQGA